MRLACKSSRRSMLAVAALGISTTALPATAQLVQGPISQTTGFPVWFQDQTGRGLELCTKNNDLGNHCVFDPPNPNDPVTGSYQAKTGFGAEAFWWLADAALAMPSSPECPTCASGLLTLGVEAAFNQGIPVAGDEFTFGRVRMRIDVPYAGTYRVTHPFGSREFVVEAPGTKGINFTGDIGTTAPDFTGPTRSDIKSFLVWDPISEAPAGYVGDGATPHAVTGSPLNQNFFEVEYLGPRTDVQLKIRQPMFTVSGLVYDDQLLPAPLQVTRATYSQGRIEIMANSAPNALLTATFQNADGTLDPAEQPLVGDGSGRFYLSFVRDPMPKLVQVKATNSGNRANVVAETVRDVVTITSAVYSPSRQELTVNVASSAAAAQPQLTLLPGPRPLVGGLNVIANMAVPPATAEVKSTLGGSDVEPVELAGTSPVPNPPPGGGGTEPPATNKPPVAVNDSASTASNTSVAINVAVNDSDPDGNVVPASVKIVTSPANGSIGSIGLIGVAYTPNSGFAGTDSFAYQIADNLGTYSNSATVQVAVVAETITVDRAQFRRDTNEWRIVGQTNARTDNEMRAFLVKPSGAEIAIGVSPIDAAGFFDIRSTGSSAIPTTGDRLRLRSKKGSIVNNITFTIR